MGNTFYNMELRQFMELYADEQQVRLGDDFCIVNVRFGKYLPEFQTPARLDAFVFMFCVEGRVRLSINLKEFDMEKDQLTLIVPGYIGQLVDYDHEKADEIHFIMVGISRRFMLRLNLDLNRLYSDGSTYMENPCIRLNEEQKNLAYNYLKLAKALITSSVANMRQCFGSLIASLFFLAEGAYSRQVELSRQSAQPEVSRADVVFNRFIRLLSEYHLQERNVAFYSEKLHLSPKYFSKLIKQSSGRSAPEWIDSYVILEAKNHLKYSNMSIKEIVYRLHFSDQPTFTKFFKAHTGMTPAQFRKS